MLPIKKIYIDSRHSASDDASSTDFKVDLLVNITLPYNTAFYINNVTSPFLELIIASDRNNIIYFRIN